ncbi:MULTISPECIES: major capsid protein [Sphingomonas]|uniref:major capsid protein n=1 Tax=Sphingomonas TaxID=13687 RepID=UPI0025516717|nr:MULTISPECIES: major capsid protein [Sphingomonas]MDK8187772.1 major capsid protein [Sphingomonas zeae]MDK8217626.1 major capsid protein [Sphingomonas sp. UMB7805-LC452B]
MSILNIFRNDAFSEVELTSQVERIPHVPTMLGDRKIFTDNPIRTTALAVEERNGILSVVPMSQRGQSTNSERTTERRKMRYFDVPRIFKGDTIHSHEIQNVREFGQETVLMQIQAEVARRLSGPTGILTTLDFTEEFHRLAAVQGLLLDADGSVWYDWFDEFEIVKPAEIAFDLDSNIEYTIRPICNKLVRDMARSSQGAFTTMTSVTALCGDSFYDKFTTHVDVEKTFKNWSDASELREGGAFKAFSFAGIEWINYRGSDDNTSIKIPDDKVKFFPENAPGIFERALAPGESFEWVNTPGKERYVVPIFDRDRNSWWRQEAYGYPLHICKRPEVLRTGKQGK